MLGMHNIMIGSHNKMFSWPHSSKYTIVSLGLWFAFLAAVIAYNYGREIGWPLEALVAIALIPAVTVAVQFMFALKQFDGQDEFVRALTAKRMIGAAGLTIVLVTAWGCLQSVMPLPAAPLWLIYPLFWSAFALVSPLIRGTRA
jgi:hypothetical protein